VTLPRLGQPAATVAALAAGVAAALAGCAHIGPATIPRDRFDFNNALSDSWKEQTLLNIVRLRYADSPVFLEVSQIISGYTLEGTVQAGASTISGGSGALSIGAGGRWTDRPTITYSPMTGADFMRALITPIPPAIIFNLMDAGWPAERILSMCVQTINGMQNEKYSAQGAQAGDPEFYRLVRLMGDVQAAGALQMRIDKGTDNKDVTVLFFRPVEVLPEIEAKAREARTLLGLEPGRRQFRLVYGPTAGNPDEIAVLSRSMIHILMTLAGGVEIPAEDVDTGRASPGFAPAETDASGRPRFRISSAVERSPDAFAAVRYRDRWFWIDDRDMASKRMLSFVLALFAVAETSPRQGLPVVTITGN